jgi:phage terminase large subunit-like protein
VTTFDPGKAARAIAFFEKVLRHSKGQFKGQLFELLPWQRQIIADVFGTVDEDGFRIIREVYLEVPKKNGKSTLAAGIALLGLLGDCEPGAEVYSAAAAKDQAALVFREACSMVDQSPLLKSKLKVLAAVKKIIKRDDPSAFYAAISADGDVQDGINPHMVVADEIHRWKVEKALGLHDILTKGMIMRRQPLWFGITTAGEEEGSPLAWRYHQKAEMQAKGAIREPSFYGKIFSAGDLDWQSREARVLANPSHEDNGGPLRDKALVAELAKAQADAAEVQAYKRFHLNLWTQKDDACISAEEWALGAVPRRSLVEQPCYLGLDLSSTEDLSAMVALFPREDGTADVLPFFWIPAANVDRIVKKTKVQELYNWIRDGHLETTPGNVIDYRHIANKIRWAREVFDVQGVVFDIAFSRQISIQLAEEGMPVVEVNYKPGKMNEPTREVLRLIKAGALRHENHPVLRAHALSVGLRSNNADEVMFSKPDRARSSKRVDGMAALSVAMYGAIRATATTKPEIFSLSA